MTDAARADFWRRTIPLAPFVGGAVPFFATLLLGGFDDFQLVGRDASPLAAFGILGTICFPFAAYYLADLKHKFEGRTVAIAFDALGHCCAMS